jgi:hypothetical protein
MEAKPVAPQPDDKIVSALEKKPYSSPALRVYGTVSVLTLGGGSSLSDGFMTTKMGSDRIVKENIVRIGDHPLGIGVYLFDYKPEYREKYGHGRQIGVLADEVETVMPEAVSIHPDGYKMVSYAMLGITKANH